MKKLSVKDIIEFRRKSDRAKKTFIENIKSTKIEIPTEGGGDYWVTSLSAVCNSYRDSDLKLIDEKINELQEKINNTRNSGTKTMYQRNIAILQKYKTIDSKKLQPNVKLSFIKRSGSNLLLTIKGLQIEVKPSLIYTFGKKEEEKIGVIWFTAKVDGYRIEEVAMFCDMLWRFLKHNYSKKYQLSAKYCVAVDMLSGHMINYTEVEDKKLSEVLTSTLDEINKLM